MPELPEIETLKTQLEKVLPGLVINRVEVLSAKSWQGDVNQVKGLKVKDISRRGKALIINLTQAKSKSRHSELDSESSCSMFHVPCSMSLVIHLKMTGQLILEGQASLIFEPASSQTRLPPSRTRPSHRAGDSSRLKHRLVGGHPTKDFVGDLPSKHTRVIFHFTNGGTLYFNDQRKFGWIKLVPTSKVNDLPFIKNLGSEPWDLTNTQWYEILQKSKKAIKLRLLDQDKISGLGNIYANDALWLAKINPQRPASSLTPAEAKTLRQTAIQALRQGIKYGGATAQDGKYVDLQGLGGHYQDHFKVYQRKGQSCLRCSRIPRHSEPPAQGGGSKNPQLDKDQSPNKNSGPTIKRIKQGGRSTFFCPRCQK
jgi:formamidopyrimidine-DNA glycosylase